ncbi:unnamed protein product, partial [Nezara viridula]
MHTPVNSLNEIRTILEFPPRGRAQHSFLETTMETLTKINEPSNFARTIRTQYSEGGARYNQEGQTRGETKLPQTAVVHFLLERQLLSV